MNDAPRCPERDAFPTVAPPAADRLERYKRASLGRQALRAAWDLGALVRRVEHEAPELHPRLLDAVKILQQLALQHIAECPSRPVGAPRQGELF